MKDLNSELSVFFGKLANMVNTGAPLCRSLVALHKETENEVMRNAIGDILDRIEKGATFSEAMAHYPSLFSPSLVTMIAVGECMGNLEKALFNIVRGINDGTLQFSTMTEPNGIATDLSTMKTADEVAPVIKLAGIIICDAVSARASDIHLESRDGESARVRFRIDGVLKEMAPVPSVVSKSLFTRIKIMGNMNPSETRVSQDGRIQVKIKDKNIDIRVSVIPCEAGESIVMRILDAASTLLTLDSQYMTPANLEMLRTWYRRPSGMIIVTGPTGSGKTTALYGILNELNAPAVKIVTVEDPVEFMMKGVCQMQVNPAVGMTFPMLMRSQLRQDPDVMMLGEIRDLETVHVAIQATLTGKLVMTTLHTIDAASALQRLCDIGLETFLVNSAVTGVLAQRLLRKICTDCREACTPPDWILETLKLRKDAQYFHGKGCEKCGQTGYRGRIAIHELLPVSDEVKLALSREKGADSVRRAAIDAGMLTLREDALSKVAAGMTTLEEIMRVC